MTQTPIREQYAARTFAALLVSCAGCLLPRVDTAQPTQTDASTSDGTHEAPNGSKSGPHEAVESVARGGAGGTAAATSGTTSNDLASSSAQTIAVPAVGAVARPGEACASAHALACTAPGSSERLLCDGSSWGFTSACENGTRCNTEDPARIGECLFMQLDCQGKQPNVPYCASSKLVRMCGPDLVSASNIPCELPTPDCMNGMCTCLNVCAGACRDVTTDPEHCGMCGHSCFGGECILGECRAIELARAQNVTQTQLAQDDERVYWTSTTGIAFVAKAGGPIQMLVSRKQAGGGIVANASHVYWSDRESGAISKISRNGGTPIDVATGLPTDRLSINGTYLYIASSEQGIHKMPLTGGAPTLIASDQGYVSSLVANERYLYWIGDGSIKSASVADDTVLELASDSSATKLALGDDDIFWVRSSTIMRLSLSGGQPSPLASVSATAIAANSSHVYVLGLNITKISISDSTSEKLLRVQNSDGDLLLDEMNIYWMSDSRVFSYRK